MFEEKQITVEGRKLLYKSHILIETKTDIVKYLVIDHIIVILTAGSNLNTDQNVFGYDLQGNVKWQIGEPSAFHERN